MTQQQAIRWLEQALTDYINGLPASARAPTQAFAQQALTMAIQQTAPCPPPVAAPAADAPVQSEA